MTDLCAGQRFLTALSEEKPLQIVGAINAYSALLAQQCGFRALYLSGAGVANASFALPDLGLTHLGDVLEDARRIINACELPLLVDIDTGWGHAFTIQRAIKELIKAGAAAVHIEDQASTKRCGHRPGKKLVSPEEMCDRIKAAQDAKTDRHFSIMARTDALANEGLTATVQRISQYVEAGADMIFLEGAGQLTDYQTVAQAIKVPLLANMTEFGVTPLFSTTELKNHGVNMVLYPLTAFRTMNKAALNAYQVLRRDGSQQAVIPEMQTRQELYEILNYHQYEESLNQFLTKEDHSNE